MSISKSYLRTSLVVQWLRIRLSMQGTQVGSIVIFGLGGAHMPWSNEAYVPKLLSLCSRASALQHEKLLQ